jgi:peptide/nickel transport system substrate-binding protein
VLTLGIQNEALSFNTDLTGGNPSIGGANQVVLIGHNHLAADNGKGEFRAQLAEELPSAEKGSWQVKADGTMDVTWKIRPNVRWHDGTPFTSGDMLFTFGVLKDPEVPTGVGRALALMESASAPDPLTLIVHWSRTYIDADHGNDLIPIPKHLLEDLYQADKPNLANSPWFTTDFVGLGPYRLVHWQRGSHMEFARFEEYFRGRPPLGSVIVRFLGDPNTMIANILSGAVDVLLPIGIEVDAAIEVKRRWEGTGNQVIVDTPDRFRVIEIQFRPEYASPVHGFTQRSVRRGLYHAIDRQSMTDALTQGLAPAADSWIRLNHELRPRLESAIPQYPYDPALAQQLLAQAGWVKGRDGLVVHRETAEPFVTVLYGHAGQQTEQEAAIIADGWKSAGLQVSITIAPPAVSTDREFASTRPGARVGGSGSATGWHTQRFHSKEITSSTNRWQGNNRGGYSNPRVDALLDRLQVTIASSERVSLLRELLQEQMGDLPAMPLYWYIDPVLALKGVTGVEILTWNFFAWDKQ